MKEKFGDCNVFAFSCEGYKGVSQSAGHHIANNGIFTHLLGDKKTEHTEKYKINLLGEYNIGAEATAKSLRKIVQYFDEQELIDRVEEVIEDKHFTEELEFNGKQHRYFEQSKEFTVTTDAG